MLRSATTRQMDETANFNSSKPIYNYRPLEGPRWVRVVQLYPAYSHIEPLKCLILHLDRERLAMSIDENFNNYSAVSYTWGSSTFSQDLIVESIKGNSVVKISLNVDAMLRRFRKKVKPLNLWIDAICLDQSNKQELGQQVQLMGEIYSQAKKVRVWMGDEDEDIAKVFAFFRMLSNIDQSLSNKTEGVEAIKKIILDVFGSQSTTSIERFFHRSWFTRRWVLQEMVLGRVIKVNCHDQQISWPLLSRGLERFVQIREANEGFKVLSLDTKAQNALATVHSFTRPRRTLLQNLWEYHASECSDPRDRLFALLGFSTDGSLQAPDQTVSGHRHFVDYTSSAESVFSRFAAVCVSAGHVNIIMQHTFAFGSLSLRDQNAVSWCPDWSQRRREETTICDKAIGQKCKLSNDGRRIFLRQAAVDVINSTGHWTGSPTWTSIADAMYKLLPPALTRHDHHRTSKNCNLLGRALCSVLLKMRKDLLSLTTAMKYDQIEKLLGKLLASSTTYEKSSFRNVPRKDVDLIKREFLQAITQLMSSYSLFSIQLQMEAISDSLESGPIATPFKKFGLGFGPRDIRQSDIVLLPVNWTGSDTCSVIFRRVVSRTIPSPNPKHQKIGLRRCLKSFFVPSLEESNKTNGGSDPKVSIRNKTPGQPNELVELSYVHKDETRRRQETMTAGILSNPSQDELDWMKEKWGWQGISLCICRLNSLVRINFVDATRQPQRDVQCNNLSKERDIILI